MNKLTTLTEENKQQLLAKTFYVLPDNPSDKRFSATQIKKKGYEGHLVLFDFLKQIIGEMNQNIDINLLDLAKKADLSKSIIVIQNSSADISAYETGQVFYVIEDAELEYKNAQGTLSDLNADVEERYASIAEIEAMFN